MSLDNEVLALRQVPMFAGFDPARLKLLAFSGARVTYPAGHPIFAQGEVADAAYVILEGEVEVLINTSSGPLKVAQLGVFDLFGEMGILSNSARSASVKAVSPVVALRLDKDVFIELLQQFPAMAVAVMRELAHRLERTNAQLAQAIRQN